MSFNISSAQQTPPKKEDEPPPFRPARRSSLGMRKIVPITLMSLPAASASSTKSYLMDHLGEEIIALTLIVSIVALFVLACKCVCSDGGERIFLLHRHIPPPNRGHYFYIPRPQAPPQDPTQPEDIV